MATQKKWRPKLGEIGQVLKNKWAEYVIQIFIIFFSVSISFSVDKWKDSLKRQDTEQLYLKSLHENLQSDSLELVKTINETKLVLDKGRFLLGLIHLNKATDVNLIDFQTSL